MKRIGKFLWRAAAWASGLLCLLLIVLWVHSMFRTSYVERYWDVVRTFPSPTHPDNTCTEDASGSLSLSSYHGKIVLGRNEHHSVFDPEKTIDDDMLEPHPFRILWFKGSDNRVLDPLTFRNSFLGFKYVHTPEQAYLIIPYWAPVLVAAVLTLLAWRRQRRIFDPGLCQQCGYDLRASKDRCPECGRPFKQSILPRPLDE